MTIKRSRVAVPPTSYRGMHFREQPLIVGDGYMVTLINYDLPCWNNASSITSRSHAAQTIQ